MSKKLLTSVVIFIFLLVAFSVVGQKESCAQQTQKIGYINLSKVFDEYNKTKDQDKILEEKGKTKEAERDKIVAEIKKMKDEMELLSDNAKQKKQDQIDEKLKKLQEFDTTTRTDLRKQRDEMVRDILKEIDKVIQEHGKKEGFTLILNDRALLYGREQLDITGEVLGILNSSYKK